MIALTFAAPFIATVALKFSYTEYFAIAIFGIIMVITSGSRKSFLKGLLTGTFGLFLATVGQDKMGTVERFTFGILDLSRGCPAACGGGSFCRFPGPFSHGQGAKAVQLGKMEQKAGLWGMFKIMMQHKMTLLKSSGIGTGVGAIPGTGAAIASFVAYSEAKRASKHPETFGEGGLTELLHPSHPTTP